MAADAVILATPILPSADSQVADGVEVRPKDVRISEHLVAKRVDPIEHDANIGRHNPVLHTQATAGVLTLGQKGRQVR